MPYMDIFAQLAQKIITAQKEVIGPLAIEQARKVNGLNLGNSEKDVVCEGDKKQVINDLIKQYEGIFGLASVEVCRDAVKDLLLELPKDQLPPLLA